MKNRVLHEYIILHSNIRGFRSKKDSLVANESLVNADLISLNEHGVCGNNKINIENYVTFSKNRTSQKLGGASLSIKEDEKENIVKIKEGIDDDEYVIVRNSSFLPPINFISYYGEQENRVPKEKVEEKWYRFVSDLAKIKNRNEDVVITADMNKHRK